MTAFYEKLQSLALTDRSLIVTFRQRRKIRMLLCCAMPATKPGESMWTLAQFQNELFQTCLNVCFLVNPLSVNIVQNLRFNGNCFVKQELKIHIFCSNEKDLAF